MKEMSRRFQTTRGLLKFILVEEILLQTENARGVKNACNIFVVVHADN